MSVLLREALDFAALVFQSAPVDVVCDSGIQSQRPARHDVNVITSFTHFFHFVIPSPLEPRETRRRGRGICSLAPWTVHCHSLLQIPRCARDDNKKLSASLRSSMTAAFTQLVIPSPLEPRETRRRGRGICSSAPWTVHCHSLLQIPRCARDDNPGASRLAFGHDLGEISDRGKFAQQPL